MTTFITYRQATQVAPGSTTTKGSGLTNAEVDGNWKSVASAIDTINAALANFAPINNPTFTGTVAGITSTMVGLGNVDNTSDVNKPVSSATTTQLNLKQATLVSGTNIRTVNGNTLLGSTDITVQATLVSGTNIKTVGGVSLLGSGDVPVSSAGANLYLAENYGAL